eukprot:4268055-Pleurochrysis_carterae.AAC.1
MESVVGSNPSSPRRLPCASRFSLRKEKETFRSVEGGGGGEVVAMAATAAAVTPGVVVVVGVAFFMAGMAGVAAVAAAERALDETAVVGLVTLLAGVEAGATACASEKLQSVSMISREAHRDADVHCTPHELSTYLPT